MIGQVVLVKCNKSKWTASIEPVGKGGIWGSLYSNADHEGRRGEEGGRSMGEGGGGWPGLYGRRLHVRGGSQSEAEFSTTTQPGHRDLLLEDYYPSFEHYVLLPGGHDLF